MSCRLFSLVTILVALATLPLAGDSESGKQLWSSRFGGNFIGSPAMYEMDGKTYLLVPAASTAGGRGRSAGPVAAPTNAPMGWVAYSLLPKQ